MTAAPSTCSAASALGMFVQRSYQPIHDTPMSSVRVDCEAVFDGNPRGAVVWEGWLGAIAAAEPEDIAFRLS